MVRTVKSHQEEEEEDDDEFLSRANDGSSQKGEKSNDQKLNSHRSKHSETEQRRRSKINERFQILRDLIPQNDQKRDKASFLLEVIQYIQFLQEKLQIYEGTYQDWSLEQPSKLMPWKNSCGPVEGLIDQSQLIKNGSLHEDSIIVSPPALLNNAPHSIESDLSGPTTYEASDHPHHALNIAALQPNLFEGVPVPPQGSFSDALHMASQSQSRFWHGRPCSTTECSVPIYSSTEQDDLKIRSEEEASISNSYSQELLNSITHALKSSGVDVSQASISVQLDVSKQTNNGINSTVFRPQEHMNRTRGNQETTHYTGGRSGEDGNQAHKRLRMEQS